MAPLGGLARQPRGFGVILVLGALVPATWIVYAMLSDLFMGTSFLGADPVKSGEHQLGAWTLRLLLATLAITPLRRITGWNWLARHRRTLGLFAFAYVSLHLLTWALLDVQIGISDLTRWADVKKDILERPFITIGMTAFVLMIPLALTSTKQMIARLGKRWRTLHRLVYVIPVLGVIHYWMAVKLDITEPGIYGLILASLLLWRAREARLRRAAAVGDRGGRLTAR